MSRRRCRRSRAARCGGAGRSTRRTRPCSGGAVEVVRARRRPAVAAWKSRLSRRVLRPAAVRRGVRSPPPPNQAPGRDQDPGVQVDGRDVGVPGVDDEGDAGAREMRGGRRPAWPRHFRGEAAVHDGDMDAGLFDTAAAAHEAHHPPAAVPAARLGARPGRAGEASGWFSGIGRRSLRFVLDRLDANDPIAQMLEPQTRALLLASSGSAGDAGSFVISSGFACVIGFKLPSSPGISKIRLMHD